LRPLKVALRDLALRFPVLVGPRACVVYEGQSYAMPPEAVGLIGVLQLFPDRVHIVAGRYEATHPRRGPSTFTAVELAHAAATPTTADSNVSNDRSRVGLRRPAPPHPSAPAPSV
jgi:hypothetical protein